MLGLLVLLSATSVEAQYSMPPGSAIPTFFGAPPTRAAGTEEPSSPTKAETKPGQGAMKGTASGPIPLPMDHYDPAMDNHLPTPATPEGLFGRPIRDVEKILRNLGAKRQSYAFGKYSRMSLSVYTITLFFDRERKLGMMTAEPRPPFAEIEPKARQFLLDVFLKSADMRLFRTTIAKDRLQISYLGP